MKRKRVGVLFVVALIAIGFLVGTLMAANVASPNAARISREQQIEILAVASEESGLAASFEATSDDCRFEIRYGLYLCRPERSTSSPERDPQAAVRALRLLGSSTGVLLVPDSENDRVMAFHPATGDLVDPNFIPPDAQHLFTPRKAILSAAGNTILISDQAEGVVHEYDVFGNHKRIFAPAGGPDASIMENIRGIALRPNGNLLVTVGAGDNDDAVVEFDVNGNYVGNFVARGSGGLNSPFDVYLRSGDWLVGGIASDAVHRYAINSGNYISDLTPIDTFPEQIAETPGGNVLVANFNGTEAGIVEYTPVGALVGIYDPASFYRGVYELSNGNLLVSADDGVLEIDRSGAVVDVKLDGVTAQYIEHLMVEEPLLAGTKTGPRSVVIGDPLTYTITVGNFGVTSTNTTISDAIPSGTAFVQDSLSCVGGSGGSCDYEPAEDVVSWNGGINAQQAVTITFSVDTDNAVCEVPINNVAVVDDPEATSPNFLVHDAAAWDLVESNDFESDDGGLVSNTPPGEWAWGTLVSTPGSPQTAHSGSKLWATNLSGTITSEPSQHLLTRTLELDDNPAELVWWDWWDGDGADSGTVTVAGSVVYSVTINQHEWMFHSVDLTPWQGATVDVVFRYEALGISAGGAGWYIDDAVLSRCVEAPILVHFPIVAND